MTLFVAVVLVLRFFENLFIDMLLVSSRNVASDKSSQLYKELLPTASKQTAASLSGAGNFTETS